jgi:hypothetical protein
VNDASCAGLCRAPFAVASTRRPSSIRLSNATIRTPLIVNDRRDRKSIQRMPGPIAFIIATESIKESEHRARRGMRARRNDDVGLCG